MIRHPAVAGQFYKATAASLRKEVEGFIVPGAERKHAFGVLAPHAGFIYSGRVAGAVFSRVDLPGTVVLIGPNHTGLGAPISLMSAGRWETPLGAVDIDEALAASILSKSPHIREDTLAHLHEHSLEVQLPFIQYFRQNFKIVPIQMLDTRLDACLALGRAVGEAIQERGRGAGGVGQARDAKEQTETKKEQRNPVPGTQDRGPQTDVLIVASSDMSHYISAERAKELDFKAIQRILDLDPEGLYRTIMDYGITMCGYGPATAMLVACKMLGATKAELIKYANSGEVSGDDEQVVGYAGMTIS